jgi:type IV secretion system protein VirB9
VPEPGPNDSRIRYVTYSKDDVTEIYVERGETTRLVLGDDEKIEMAGTGFPADCKNEALEWCIHADKGENEIWVKPKDGATRNNLELKTNKHDYSIEFKVGSAHGRKQAGGMYRVIFRYPIQLPPLATVMALQGASANAKHEASEKVLLDDRLAADKPTPRNWNYTMQVLKGGEDIAPSLVFDDGRFTYLQFPANREVPSIFYVSPAGEEARINWTMKGDLVEVQRLGRRFVLRLGDAVVGVWNDSFDPNGVAPKNGTTVQGVDRVLKQQ